MRDILAIAAHRNTSLSFSANLPITRLRNGFMKKMNELMAELGFNKNAPDSVKEAFIKHLIKASAGVNVVTPSEKKEIAENPQKIIAFKAPQQLSFEFDDTPSSSPHKNKKAVS
jgi:hypothetical protein